MKLKMKKEDAEMLMVLLGNTRLDDIEAIMKNRKDNGFTASQIEEATDRIFMELTAKVEVDDPEEDLLDSAPLEVV
jgi:hypothetical protein